LEAIDDGNFHIVSNVNGVNSVNGVNRDDIANGNHSPDVGSVSSQRNRLWHGYEFDRQQPDRGGLRPAQQSQAATV
jgi:hypothetical protein